MREEDKKEEEEEEEEEKKQNRRGGGGGERGGGERGGGERGGGERGGGGGGVPSWEIESTTYSVPERNSCTSTAVFFSPNTLLVLRIVSYACRTSSSEEAKKTPSEPV